MAAMKHDCPLKLTEQTLRSAPGRRKSGHAIVRIAPKRQKKRRPAARAVGARHFFAWVLCRSAPLCPLGLGIRIDVGQFPLGTYPFCSLCGAKHDHPQAQAKARKKAKRNIN
jgi:hypothetical protein